MRRRDGPDTLGLQPHAPTPPPLPPQDPAARFAALFALKPAWSLEEMCAYLEGVAGPGQTVEALLLAFCRCTQVARDDPPMYSARTGGRGAAA